LAATQTKDVPFIHSGEEDEKSMDNVGQDLQLGAVAADKLKNKGEELDNLTVDLVEHGNTEQLPKTEDSKVEVTQLHEPKLRIPAEEKLRKTREELEQLIVEQRENLRKVKEELEHTKAAKCKEQASTDAALKAAEEKLKQKQNELNSLKAKHKETTKNMKEECDVLNRRVRQLEIEHVKLNVDASALGEAECKLKKKQEKLNSLKAEYKKVENALMEERDALKDRVAQLQLERNEADLREVAELSQANVKLVQKDEELKYANKTIIELQNRMSDYKRLVDAEMRVESLTRENADLRECHQMLLRGAYPDGRSEEPSNLTVSLHSGNHLNMILYNASCATYDNVLMNWPGQLLVYYRAITAVITK